ncbi:DUF4174 domain-containing protein [Flavilitoribacter nigricans]|uniref:DUF4174 domain-containing protein n=1 Tax=Flavilitoribacter nigricans (strain ATCC 23147 / DSM 23189 / NBRC 102662 / NCIMB 1420 / SS-2) TaxID=1122177 RepID=A0A2D0MXF1_FLAN2|nr:DUF4174 domain-containing protein [Flavilitoribacter nigricans]PHN00816.1 hypothetical protein CRP01_40225 [Flavilitoribacter nigricans DSM 23189 = NBRC 102662]
MKQGITLIILFMSMMTLNGQPLAKHQWKDRLILVFSNSPGDSVATEQLERFREDTAAVKDRDLLIYRITPAMVNGPGGQQETTSEWFYKYYRVGKDEFNIILIGKDGGEKLRSEQLIQPEKIFDLIDTMPMRRAEMKRDKQGSKQ